LSLGGKSATIDADPRSRGGGFMAKRQKSKGRNRPPTPSSPSHEEINDAPGATGAAPEEPFTPNPPRRNTPLLLTSIVLLLVWLAILTWLAVTAQ
jgi:hypothetical protein